MLKGGGQERMHKSITVKWNRDRGLLENFDPKLELKMLSEEAKEFYAAETLAHMLAEYADFLFVLDGTKAKFGSQLIPSHIDIDMRLSVYGHILDWADTVEQDIRSCIISALGGNYHEINGLVSMARGHVVSCNNLKGSKKVNGKVVKNKEHIDPVDLIQADLDRLGF
jgi:hypothetical protein